MLVIQMVLGGRISIFTRPFKGCIRLKMTSVRVINRSGNELPAYETTGSAGMDIRANLEDPLTMSPGSRSIVPTGIYLEIPPGFECQVRPRSGLAIKNGVTVLNAPGTIDSDYRGEVKVILINLSDSEYVVENGQRIAQLVFAKYERVVPTLVAELSTTERGEGGFGSTGTS